jgi:topoisomerase-like DNA binding C4 zinc finger protein
VNQLTPINRAQLIALITPALEALEQLMTAINPQNPDAEPEFHRPAQAQREQWTPPQPIKDNGPECPKCQGPMRMRKGSRGPFWGCQSYPQCDGTRQPKPNDDIRREMQNKATANSRGYRGAMTVDR